MMLLSMITHRRGKLAHCTPTNDYPDHGTNTKHMYEISQLCGITSNPSFTTRSYLMCVLRYFRNLKYLPAKRPIRDTWVYNNYLYMLLGHVAEVLGKDTWENLVASRILVPLGMNSTRILKTPSDVLEADVARPYIYRDGGFQNGTLEIYE